MWGPFKGIVGGILLILMAYLFSMQYLGLGLGTIQNCLQGGKVSGFAFLLKTLFTSITLNCGGSGGIVTPIFYVGSTSGNLFAQLFHLDLATFSALGLVALLSRRRQYSDCGKYYGYRVIRPANRSLRGSCLRYKLFGYWPSKCLSFPDIGFQEIKVY